MFHTMFVYQLIDKYYINYNKRLLYLQYKITESLKRSFACIQIGKIYTLILKSGGHTKPQVQEEKKHVLNFVQVCHHSWYNHLIKAKLFKFCQNKQYFLLLLYKLKHNSYQQWLRIAPLNQIQSQLCLVFMQILYLLFKLIKKYISLLQNTIGQLNYVQMYCIKSIKLGVIFCLIFNRENLFLLNT
eukprot:TRINITY_DN5436_c1_g1_i2.p3 TRINITY_DN5436_c1_g1~~TRINITY_DN5436_c1_g1_i2.p3  ORF type:complete len:186 (+),score=-23.67 TRINITY_DN5436_c1_g1_i2:915-1472(+)